MTPTPYITYGGSTVAEVTVNSDEEFKNEGQFDAWASAEAYAHKVSISPEARHSVEKSFTL